MRSLLLLTIALFLPSGCSTTASVASDASTDASFPADASLEAEASAGPKHCERVTSPPCPEGCRAQDALAIADGGACANVEWMYCGDADEGVLFDITCWVRLSDGVPFRFLSRTGDVGSTGFRPCTSDEAQGTESTFSTYCR